VVYYDHQIYNKRFTISSQWLDAESKKSDNLVEYTTTSNSRGVAFVYSLAGKCIIAWMSLRACCTQDASMHYGYTSRIVPDEFICL
jgi:hypothetical protein